MGSVIYSNLEFFILLAFALSGYLFVRGQTARLLILVSASFVFYAWASFFNLSLFLFVVAVSWLGATLARRFPRQKTACVVAGICVMAAHLLFWKYAPWLVATVQRAIPHLLDGGVLRLPLPIGISFYTLQGIAYLVDYHRGEAKLVRFRQYLLFKSFFAQLVAGPIVRAHQIMPQLEKLRSPEASDSYIGISLFARGLFKKLVIADALNPLVSEVFSQPESYGRMALVRAVCGFSVQIWADFSGYTDMGRGAARMLGISLPENFLSPYLSRSPSEFWQRWHITLSQWIRDYIYIPLGGSRGGLLRVFSVVLVTMSISGLWHGAGLPFLLWGLYHGALLAGERYIRGSAFDERYKQLLPLWAQTVGLVAVTNLLVLIGWILFRVHGGGGLYSFLSAMILTPGVNTAVEAGPTIYFGLFACALHHMVFYSDLSGRHWLSDSQVGIWIMELRLGRLGDNRLAARAASMAAGCLLAVTMAVILFFRAQRAEAFIYFQF